MKKTIVFLTVLLALCFAAFAAEHARTEIKYLHRYDWGGENEKYHEQYVEITYVDNLGYFYEGYGNRFWLLVRTKGSSVADGIYVDFAALNTFPLSSKSGAWLGGYGAEGGPYATEILNKNKYVMTKEEVLNLNIKIIEMFRDEYLSKENHTMRKLPGFCEIVNALNKEQLRLLRNTIYANYGYKFKADDLNEIFSQCDWYKVDGNFSEERFTDAERVYLTLIKQAEQIAK